jgi:hypothetical protein
LTLVAPERRRIAVVSGETRVDVALPLDDTLGDALRSLGYPLVAGRHVVLNRTGAEAQLGALVSEVPDGSLFAIVDLLEVPTTSRVRATNTDSSASDAAIWWMLGMVAVVAIGVVVVGSSAAELVSPLLRVIAVAALAVTAISTALIQSRRLRHDEVSRGLAMLGPIAVAFAAGFIAIPLSLVSGIQLAVVTGLLASAIVAALLALVIGGLRLRSAAGTATVILLVLAAVWGLVLLTGGDAAASAAVSVGAVPLALRALPSTMLDVPDGYHIDYALFMSTRWSVRGAIPESPDSVRMSAVTDIVAASSARLLCGTAILSAAAAAFTPIALTAARDGEVLVFAASITLMVTVLTALVLGARHTANPVLRWIPRAAAGLIVVETTIGLAASFPSASLLMAAIGCLAVGVFAAAVLVPIGRGARSLVWSRVADVLEWIAIAISLPAGVLAANTLDVLRGMMAA